MGDKAGSWAGWYKKNIPMADDLFDDHLRRLRVGQRQVSKIERGDLDSAKIGTIRSYLEAVSGGLAIEYVMGDERVQVA